MLNISIIELTTRSFSEQETGPYCVYIIGTISPQISLLVANMDNKLWACSVFLSELDAWRIASISLKIGRFTISSLLLNWSLAQILPRILLSGPVLLNQGLFWLIETILCLNGSWTESSINAWSHEDVVSLLNTCYAGKAGDLNGTVG